MISHIYRAIIAACFFCVTAVSNSFAAPFEEKAPVGSISVGVEFSSGSYNGSSTTRTIYMPIIATWYPSERLDFAVELPYIYQSSSQVTTTLFQNSTVPQTVARRGGPGGMLNASSTNTATNSSTTGNMVSNHAVSGLGDIILRAGYIVSFENNKLPQFRSSFFVKTPTAAVDDGLGTGEFDYGGGFDLSKMFGKTYLAAEALYNAQGKVEGFGLKNYFSFNGTAGYQLTESVRPMIVLKGATAPSEYSEELLEVRGRLLWELTHNTALDSFLSKGISNSSPDYSAGIALSYAF